MCTEEILRAILLEDSVSDFNSMMAFLRKKGDQSRTARLWLDGFIRPVIIAMRFVRASREADWSLHITTVRLMIPYFAAAGHWHYLRYAIVYLMKMTNLPEDLLAKFLAGEHTMRQFLWGRKFYGPRTTSYPHSWPPHQSGFCQHSEPHPHGKILYSRDRLHL